MEGVANSWQVAALTVAAESATVPPAELKTGGVTARLEIVGAAAAPGATVIGTSAVIWPLIEVVVRVTVYSCAVAVGFAGRVTDCWMIEPELSEQAVVVWSEEIEGLEDHAQVLVELLCDVHEVCALSTTVPPLAGTIGGEALSSSMNRAIGAPDGSTATFT
jgi:hypothetical protein